MVLDHYEGICGRCNGVVVSSRPLHCYVIVNDPDHMELRVMNVNMRCPHCKGICATIYLYKQESLNITQELNMLNSKGK